MKNNVMEDWVKCSGFTCSFKLDSSVFFARRFNMLSEDARSAILGMAKFMVLSRRAIRIVSRMT